MKDGGPKFPIDLEIMTLRDYCAIHAPNVPDHAIISIEEKDKSKNPRNRMEIGCFLRYQWADAMLKEREKG